MNPCHGWAVLLFWLVGSTVQFAAGQELRIAVRDGAQESLILAGSDARQQLLVTKGVSGAAKDFTRAARYSVQPGSVVRVDENGIVSAIGNGSAVVTATADGAVARLPVRVEKFGTDQAINFPNQIVPIFTKLGCNAGGCHGKSGGQNGFRLSLLGFEPSEDYEHLVKEARGRRIFPAAPERSLLLEKATGMIPHGGGKRMEVGSDDYRLLVRWISQGMPYGNTSDPTVARIEVYPAERIMRASAEQQLAVTAVYTDGSTHDVTRQALYEANAQDVASVDAGGYVTMFKQPGDVAVMIRYQGKVAVFRGTEPLGAPIAAMPPVRNFIDELAFKKLLQMGMPPSPICSDSTFIRRVTIDIAGRLPTPSETKAFLADDDSARRDKLVNRLLDSPDYAEYFANKWSALLRNRRTRPTDAASTFTFHDWIRDSLLTNKPYDRFVRQILTASGDVEHNPPVAWYRQGQDANVQLQDTAQLFLGLRLLCAQCHHHPFEKWGQKDYYQFAAFFSRVGRQRAAGPRSETLVYFRPGQASATNPRTHKSFGPAGLGQQELQLPSEQDPRAALADWITAKNNPWFARALANRYWKHFFSRGIVEPEDDMRDTNPPTNPALLDALASHFVASGYDLKDLMRTICQSSLYQLDSAPNQSNAVDRQNFSRFYPKRITAETLLDAVDSLTGSQSRFDGLPPSVSAVDLPDNSYNASSYFLMVFGRPEALSACECERSSQASLAQSLHLLNAKDIQEKLTAAAGRAAALAAAHVQDAQNIDELYLLAFSRHPEVAEAQTATDYIKKAVGTAGGKDEPARRRAAYEDLIWALMNTKEFSFNH
jgi:hypothetical protein